MVPRHQAKRQGIRGKQQAKEQAQVDADCELKTKEQYAGGTGPHALPGEEPVEGKDRRRNPKPIDKLHVIELRGHWQAEGEQECSGGGTPGPETELAKADEGGNIGQNGSGNEPGAEGGKLTQAEGTEDRINLRIAPERVGEIRHARPWIEEWRVHETGRLTMQGCDQGTVEELEHCQIQAGIAEVSRQALADGEGMERTDDAEREEERQGKQVGRPGNARNPVRRLHG